MDSSEAKSVDSCLYVWKWIFCDDSMTGTFWEDLEQHPGKPPWRCELLHAREGLDPEAASDLKAEPYGGGTYHTMVD